MGFYIYIAWPLVALTVALGLLFRFNESWITKIKNMAIFSAVLVFFLFPLSLDLMRENRGYLGHLWPSLSQTGWAPRLLLSQGYLKTLFWGQDLTFFSNGPFWGGLLDPFQSSCFLFGLAFILKTWRSPLSRWLMLHFLSFSFPPC